jgi:hypothetical protein
MASPLASLFLAPQNHIEALYQKSRGPIFKYPDLATVGDGLVTCCVSRSSAFGPSLITSFRSALL